MLEQQIDFLTLEDQVEIPNDPFRPSTLKINGRIYNKPVDKDELLKVYEKFKQVISFELDGYKFDCSPKGDESERAFRARFVERVHELQDLTFTGQANFLLATHSDLTQVALEFSEIPHKLARYAEHRLILHDAWNVCDKLKDKLRAEHAYGEREHELDLVLNSGKYLQRWVQEQINVQIDVPKKDGKTEKVNLTKTDASITKDAFEKGWMLTYPDKARARIQKLREYENDMRFLEFSLEALAAWHNNIAAAAAGNTTLMRSLSKQT